MQNNVLTSRQKEVLDFIIDNIEYQGFPPTIPEVQNKFSFKSPTAVTDHLEALKRKGYITRLARKSRGIVVNINHNNSQNGNSNSYDIPVIGNVAAGTPMLAQENIEGSISVDKTIVKNPKDTFILRVKGDSMINAGIFNGDYVIIQQQPQISQGGIAAVLIDNEATIKRVFKEKNRVRLQPENNSMEPIIIDPKEKQISIIGKVKGVIRKM